ncbi:MAG: hypothetical protein ACJAT2_001638 [Bacteriovoracaceae bacterium]|jgi:hypothetical protein
MGKLRMILPFLLCLNLQAALYDIKDLEVLESSKSYREFLDHAKDIRPSSRDKHWSEMVSNMATSYIKDLLEKKSYQKEVFDYVQKLSHWAELKKDSYFQHKRHEYSTTYFKKCLGPSCVKDLTVFWNTSRQDGELAKKLALILKELDPAAPLSPFLKKIGHDDYALFHCKKPWIQSEIFKLVTEPVRMKEEEKKIKATLTTYVGRECWKSLRPIVHAALMRGPGLKQDYAYALLSAMEELPTEWKDFYHVSYFLGSPIPGKTMNESWSTIKELGQSYSRRNNVLKKLVTLDPLPGKLFSLIDIDKRKTLVGFLKKNFPEYVDHYSKTCLSYLGGAVDFANGNPTPDCDNLADGGFLEDRIKTQYSALKK